MKPNYEAMTKSELRKYVLNHKDDMEAIRLLFKAPNESQIHRYPSICTEDGETIPENLQIMEQAIKNKLNQ